jgi:endo-1,4-beta-xylanase
VDESTVRPIPPRSRRFRLLVSAACTTAMAAVLAAGLTILPGTAASAATQVCSSQTGTIDGSYYSMYTNNSGTACITLNSGTSYSANWSNIGDFVGGIGWNPGSTSRSISFSSSLSASGGTSLISLYGWSTSPLVEYYVEENYSGSPNAAGTFEGTVNSDGGTYNIYEHQQVNQPSIQGTATFEQYLAIRTSPTSSGTITFGNFVNAWASHGMNLGSMNYQILASETYNNGSGSDSVSIGGAVATTPPSTMPPTTAPPTSSAPTTPAGGPGSCKATYAVTSSWTGGYNASVTVADSGSSAISGWNVGLGLASGDTITSLWNGVNSGTTGSISVKNESYNGSLSPGASTSFGYTATGSSSTAPSVSCTSS